MESTALKNSYMDNQLIHEHILYKKCGEFISIMIDILGESPFKESFEIEGISVWDAIAPLLAAFILPERTLFYLKFGSHKYNFEYFLLRKLKQKIKLLANIYNRKSINNLKKKSNEFQAKRNVVNKSILFLNFSAKHYGETFKNVSNLLKKENYIVNVIGTYEPSIPEDDFIDIKLLNKGYQNFIKYKTNDFIRQIKTIKTKAIFDEIKSDYPTIWKIFVDSLNEIGCSILNDSALQIIMAKQIISSIQPIAVIGGDDCDYRARSYFLAANQNSIPTILIQQGMASYKTSDFMFLSTDKIAVIGEESFKILSEMGVSADKMKITGRSDFDELIKSDSGYIKSEHNKFLETKKYILFTSQPFVTGAFKSKKSRNNIIRSIYSISSPELPLVVKPHPGEDMKFHRKMAKRYPHSILVDKNCDTNRLIKMCYIFMTCSSTTALQAMLAVKPIIIVNIDQCSVHSPYYKSNAILIANSQNELRKLLKYTVANREKVLSKTQKERNIFIKRNTYLPDGKASERIKDIILYMIKNKTFEN